MEKLAEARIVAWQGGSLWLLSTTSAGADEMPRTDYHAHHAVQVVMSLGGRFRLSAADDDVAGPFAAVAPDVSHRFDALGAYAMLFVEPESRAGRAIIAEAFRTGGLCAMPAARFEGLARQLSLLGCMPPPDREQLAAIGREMVDHLVGDLRQPAIDARVERVVTWASRDHDERITLDAAARVAGLSASRLSHLFVEATGLSFKTYLLWVRLTRAVGLMADGATLTEAAHGAGFADSAHFSRTFRRMFGIAPANLKMI
jgi:AraC family transcriptional regulator